MKEQKRGCTAYQELEREYKRLQRCFDDFNQLKFTVSGLDDFFSGGLPALNQQASTDLKLITLLFKKLEAQLQQLDMQMRNDCCQGDQLNRQKREIT